eukprot:CAMPEP_0116100302 /NCGR_PEP_ID=MMETSP0327-20121206/12222_1 /TAXON_ID=44447 /ORGANISM="Pseudo-nitzschia delicatissima, Strain B596" /LENGTH=694 /DNA_ID=CAMNT_0003592223 /DNA_START=220 /DNA_END=2304 /DNA_ORIENTATION=-
MSMNKLATYFGKRKRTSGASLSEPLDNRADPLPNQDSDEGGVYNKADFPSTSTRTVSISSNDGSSDENSTSDLNRKPAALSKCDSETSSVNPFLMLGSDVMVGIVSFLEPRETLTLLTVPLCKEWRLSYTADQDLWRTVCCTEPFAADLSIYGAPIEASISQSENQNDDDNDNDNEEDNSFCSMEDYKDAFEKKNVLVGEYRLIYTSFVRCMKYLDQIQNHDGLNKSNSSWERESDESNRGNMFPTFGVTKSLKKFLSRSKERGILKSVIGNGTTDDIPSAPIGVSTDGREIHKGAFSKKDHEKDDDQKPKYGQSMITMRLWGPTAAGVPSHLNLPKSCAIYSIVNWMVAHPNVRGIQTMCIKALPPLLEDEQQRLTGRRVGLVEVIMCAMLRFPDSVELHIAVFHAIVLLARPLGGREGMLFNNSMAENTQNIGLTSPVELSDPISLASRCGGHPVVDGKKSNEKTLARNESAPSDVDNEKGQQSGIAILVESMTRFAHSEKLQSMACWALVNVALVPIQKNMLMKLDGVEAILSAMEKHSTSFDVQFRALFALINLAVPCRESDFMFDASVDAADATYHETAVLDKLREKIARLSVAAMKNFWSSESILNRGCLVIHNLSQSSEFIRTLLHTPDCCQMLKYCLENHSTDRVLRRSVASTLQRMQFYLDQHPEEQDPFSLRYQPNGDGFEQVW